MKALILELRTWAGGFLITLLACTLVAIIIFMSTYDSDATDWRIFMVSYCYGVCIHFSIHFWHKLFPGRSLVLNYNISSLIGFIIGTLLTIALLVLTGSDLSGWLSQTLLYALLASVVIIFMFFNQQQKLNIRTELKTAQLQQAEKDKKLLQSQLRLLQSQIEPHFLFNTLANLKALMYIDVDRASHLLDHLTLLLRHNLKHTREDQVSLKYELSFCQSYLAIQKIRLGCRLNVNVTIAEEVNLEQNFPPLLLQPLVENAILHGVASTLGDRLLNINVSNHPPDKLLITVEDNGIGLGNSIHQGFGVGLDNIHSRLKSLYADSASLRIIENDMGGVTAYLLLPVENEVRCRSVESLM
ncbi:sensor histidine kinase [Chania multitudinisentens]|uniref:sensor histidine kinase n=1 Tax=Chania multitudinisentens TaxID=1639108 RepID=UPI0003E12AD7|nr:histidine kinase [Chania multitudinisentens]